MDLQRRISRLLAIAGVAFLASGVVAGAFIGNAGAAPQDQRDHPGDHPTTSTTREPKSERTTTTTGRKGTTSTTASAAAATTTTTAPATTTTTRPPTTTSTSPATTTTTAAATSGQKGSAREPSPESHRETAAAEVAPTTSSTVNAPISRGPKSPVVPPGSPPPAAPVTSTTVANPVPPAPIANPLPRTPVTALSGPPPNPLTLGGVEEDPVGPPLPPWEAEATVPEAERPRPAAGEATETPTRRRAGQLSMTGSATRTLLFLAGVALLLGSVAVALGEPGPVRAARAMARETTGTKVKARTRRLRRTIPGWESGVPLAPTRRAAKRARLQRRGRVNLSRLGAEPGA